MSLTTLTTRDASNASQSLSAAQDGTNSNALIGATMLCDPATGQKMGVMAVGGDGLAVPSYLASVASFLLGWNGTSWDRIHAHPDNADGAAADSSGGVHTVTSNFVFNGTSWDRQRSAGATGVTAVGGAAAAAAAVAGNPIRAGTQASAATQTATAGNAQDLFTELSGNLRVVERPVDVGALGSYRISTVSGTMVAGLTGGSVVWAFRTGSANSYIVRRVVISMWDVTTAFTAGLGKFALFIGRTFSASYSSGGNAATITTNNGKKKTGMGTTGIAQIYTAATGAISGATVTLDAQPIAQQNFQVSATANAVMLPTSDLLNYTGAGPAWPPTLAANEGLVLQATVPATGTWAFQVDVEWDEVVTAP